MVFASLSLTFFIACSLSMILNNVLWRRSFLVTKCLSILGPEIIACSLAIYTLDSKMPVAIGFLINCFLFIMVCSYAVLKTSILISIPGFRPFCFVLILYLQKRNLKQFCNWNVCNSNFHHSSLSHFLSPDSPTGWMFFSQLKEMFLWQSRFRV